MHRCDDGAGGRGLSGERGDDADADETALDTSRDDDVDLAQKIFDLELAEGARDETAAVMAIVERRNMAATYATLCERFAWRADAALTAKMADANAERLGEIEAKIEDAKENLGDVEIRDAMCERAEFYASVGEMEKSERAYEETEAKTASIGQKMDCAFALMRARFSRLELHEVKKLIEKTMPFCSHISRHALLIPSLQRMSSKITMALSARLSFRISK